MIHLRYVRPLFGNLVTLRLNILTVAATTYITMSFLVARFEWWLMPYKIEGDPRKSFVKTTQRGLGIIMGILIAEAGTFGITHV